MSKHAARAMWARRGRNWALVECERRGLGYYPSGCLPDLGRVIQVPGSPPTWIVYPDFVGDDPRDYRQIAGLIRSLRGDDESLGRAKWALEQVAQVRVAR